MLTWSNWKQELRGNRYHFAIRFAKYLPVIFVQEPKLKEEKYLFEMTGYENITLLNIPESFNCTQISLLNSALRSMNIMKPLLWVYNCHFAEFLEQIWSPLVVYHATEDYFSDSPNSFLAFPYLHKLMSATLQKTDLLISVSEGVATNLLNANPFTAARIVVTNGCDYKFYAQGDVNTIIRHNNVVLYQGNISDKIDFELLHELIKCLSEYEFWLCGKAFQCELLQAILQLPNVKYLSILSCEELKILMHKATVGIIPFKNQDHLTKSAFPLKAFEYLACGLPVIATPLESLQTYADLIAFATSAIEFAAKIREASIKVNNPALISLRKLAASKQDYDLKFVEVCTKLQTTLKDKHQNVTCNQTLNILFLYDAGSVHVGTTRDHLLAFKHYSKHNIFYANAIGHSQSNIDFSAFDVIVIHYSVRLCLKYVAHTYLQALKDYTGYKILFIQDEYDTTNIAKEKILNIGIHTVFTAVSTEYLDKVYPTAEFSKVKFIQNLSGYMPEHLSQNFTIKPACERTLMIGYRGRNLPYWYGNLGREKYLIGKTMRQICNERNIVADIEVEDQKRIYGDKWFDFLANCRATLGTESGSNVFDFDGQISHKIKRALNKNPALTYEEIFATYLKKHEGKIIMNQISPKIFEAIALRTALILFEGSYSNVVQPNIHYIPLKKDFSNVDDVLAKLADCKYIDRMTEQSYQDIVQSGLYSYRHFVQNVFDAHIDQMVKKNNDYELIPIVYARKRKQPDNQEAYLLKSPGSIVAQELLTDARQLILINSIIEQSFTRNYKSMNPIKQFVIPFFINRIATMDPGIFKFLLQLNKLLPGKPLSKVYSLIKMIYN
jgi:glycosyltransferase involved in cell wall biosynthesis